MTLDPLLVERFRKDLKAIWPGWSDPSLRLGVAVSGGPDSLALLLLAHAAMPGRIEVATVDHQLRATSADETRFVVDLCEQLGVPATVLTVDVAQGNLQREARSARYQALAGWAQHRLAAVATAHHADDQAETLVMRLNRSSGLSGLAGVRARTQLDPADCQLLRPLLGWRKAELEAIVAAAGIEAVADPSNADDRFDRARLRKALSQADWLDPVALAQSAAHLAEVEDEILRQCRLEMLANARVAEGRAKYTPKVSPYIAKRVVQIILAELGAEVGLGQVNGLIERLASEGSANLGGILVRQAGGELLFEPEPPRRSG